MGRSLTNAMVNLGMDSEVEEGVYEVRNNLHMLVIYVFGEHTVHAIYLLAWSGLGETAGGRVRCRTG